MSAYTQAYQAEALERLSKPPKHIWVGVLIPDTILSAYQEAAAECGVGTQDYMAAVLVGEAPLRDSDGR